MKGWRSEPEVSDWTMLDSIQVLADVLESKMRFDSCLRDFCFLSSLKVGIFSKDFSSGFVEIFSVIFVFE